MSVPGRPGRPGRVPQEARVAVRFGEVVLLPPESMRGAPPVKLWAVLAQ